MRISRERKVSHERRSRKQKEHERNRARMLTIVHSLETTRGRRGPRIGEVITGDLRSRF